MYIVTDKFTSCQEISKMLFVGSPSNLFLRLKKMRNFCGIYFCDWKNLGTFEALIFAIWGQNRKNLFRKN